MDAKSRSPRYPQVTLKEVLERVRMLYAKEHRHKADKEVVAKDLGYAGLNGASLGMIAALKHYNLIESVGDGLRVSDDAVTILELPHGNPERAEAIKRAAFAPKLFAELSEIYGSKLPSDENLRLYLVRKGFGDKAASSIVRTYKDTISLVQEETGDYNGGATQTLRSQESVQSMPPTPAASSATTQHNPSASAEANEGVYTLSTLLSFQRNVRAEVKIFGSDLKKSDITRLKKAIADLEGAFEEEPEGSPEQLEDKGD
jgi:hypothetical protein